MKIWFLFNFEFNFFSSIKIFVTGGIMTDYVTPYEDPAEVIDPHYSGCMSNLIVNGQHYPLNLERGWTGWSIGDCDGTACGAEVWTPIFQMKKSYNPEFINL